MSADGMAIAQEAPRKSLWRGRLLYALMVCLSLFLFLLATVNLGEVNGGFPNKLAAVLLFGSACVALPPLSKRLAAYLPLFRRRFGPLFAVILGVAATVVTLQMSLVIEKSIDPEAAKFRQARQAEEKRTRDIAAKDEARKASIEESQIAQAAAASRLQPARKSSHQFQSTFDQFWAEVLLYTQPCENAQKRLAETFAQGNFSVDAYEIARRGQQTCFSSYQSLQTMVSPESLPSGAKQSVQIGLKACADAALARMTFMSKAASIIDGDRKPSSVAAAKVQAEAAQISTLQCVAGIMDGATKAGAKIGDR